MASQDQPAWSVRHRMTWQLCLHLPDGLAMVAIVLMLLYLLGG